MDTLHISNSQYGGLYRGIVLNNSDPKGRGRMKVFVPSVYPIDFADGYDITSNSEPSASGSKLPWAEPSQPLFCGGFGANGMTQCPDKGTHVWVMFEAGNVQHPIVVGVIQQTDASFVNGKSIMTYGGITVTFEKETNTLTIEADNVIVKSKKTDVTSDDVFVTSKTTDIKGDTVLITGKTTDIKGDSGDCVIQKVSLVNHKHWEMQSGDVVSPKSTKTETALNSL